MPIFISAVWLRRQVERRALRALFVVLAFAVGARHVAGQNNIPGQDYTRAGIDFNSPARGFALSESPPLLTMQQDAIPVSEYHTTCPRAQTSGTQRIDGDAPYDLFGGKIGANWFDNFAILGGFDGARGPEDLGINANVGGRFAAQTAMPLIESKGLALQIGSALNYHNTATRLQRLNGGPHERTQSFTTLGLFMRADNGFISGFAYDYLHSHSYANLDLGQWRFQAGMRFNPDNEFGIAGSHRERGDAAVFAGERFGLQAINQTNLYFTHFWEHNAMTRAWVGLAERHGRVILAIPGGTPVNNAFIYGAEFLAPLNSYVSLYAEANLITPLDSGSVTAFVGIAFYPGGTANEAPRGRFAPLFPLANNANFAIDAAR